ncbi:hypothetical protein CRC_01414 [Cylindrospermopsis raciborskii CS-505]|nr:hypothetical protein CRC_01414 [Cylindrospermopsis raciborskii CS-505]
MNFNRLGKFDQLSGSVWKIEEVLKILMGNYCFFLLKTADCDTIRVNLAG